MNDKIRKEFIKYVAALKKGNIEDDSVYDFEDFEAGYKSRNDEVLALSSRVAVAEGDNEELKAENKKLNEDCRNLVTVNNNQAGIMNSKDDHIKELYHRTCISKEKIKELRNACVIANEALKDVNLGERIKAERTIEEALRDGV